MKSEKKLLGNNFASTFTGWAFALLIQTATCCSLHLRASAPITSYSNILRNAWHAGIWITRGALPLPCTLIHRMVHTPLRVHVQHTSALSDRSQPYYTYMHQHTCSRLHMLSHRYVTIHPECACLCIFHGCFWAWSPAPIPIPQYTLKLPNWQYSNAVSDAGDTLEAYLIWRRKRLQFSAWALPMSPPRSFMEGQKGNELSGQIRASIAKNKDSSPHIIFLGETPDVPPFWQQKSKPLKLQAWAWKESLHICV